MATEEITVVGLESEPMTRTVCVPTTEVYRGDPSSAIIAGCTRTPDGDERPRFYRKSGLAFREPVHLRRVRSLGDLRFKDCTFNTLWLEDADLLSLRFENCRFAERLQASGMRVAGRLGFKNCYFEKGADCSGISAAVLRLDQCTFVCPGAPNPSATVEPDARSAALTLNVSKIARSVRFNDYFAWGETSLIGTSVEGEFAAKDAKMINPQGSALFLRELNLKRSAHLKGITAHGEVNATGAQIGGALTLAGSTFAVRTGRALDLLGVHTGRFVDLNDVAIRGTLRMTGAVIGGLLTADRLRVDPAIDAGPGDLEARNLRVERQLCFEGSDEKRVELSGIVDLSLAQVGDDLCFGNVDFRSGLILRNATLGSKLELTSTTVAKEADLSTMSIANDVTIDGHFVGGLTLARTDVDGDLKIEGASVSPDSTVDLRDASVVGLFDDTGAGHGTSEARNLILSGLTFKRIDSGVAATKQRAERRISWLRRQKTFDIAPYQQVAKVYRDQGDDNGARRVLVDSEWDRLERGGVSWQGRVWGFLLGMVSGFGNRLSRSLYWLAGLIVVSSLVFWVYGDAMHAKSSASTQEQCTNLSAPDPKFDNSGISCFQPIIYGINAVVPALPFHQTDTWVPATDTRHGQFLDIFLRVMQVLGWTLAAAVAAALARLYARRE